MIELASEVTLRCQRCGCPNAYDEPCICHGCGVRLVTVGDGLPTMGEEAESELSQWTCTCGEPDRAGIVHRQDAPCYYLEKHDAPL